MTPSKKLFEIITFPRTIAPFLCEKRNNRLRLLIILGNTGFEISARPKLVSVHISLTLVLFKFPDVQSHGRQTRIDPVFTPEKNSWAGTTFTRKFCFCLIDLTTRTLFPRPKILWSLPEKRTISHLSVSARIRVIDRFSQIK